MSELKILECFGGIGACTKALERQNIPHKVVDYVEIDKYAVKSYNAVHGTDFEPQDIIEWDKDIEVDLIMHGSPCQDFSVAGKQAGGDEGSGTRSSLMYETLRIVEKLKPKYVIWENVKNLLSKKHRHNFDAYIDAMKKLGYLSHYSVLNAKDYGVPQNRERVFTVSIRLDLSDPWTFEFPEPIPLEKKLKDVLEKEVDDKYYISSEQVDKLLASNYDQNKRFYSPDGISPTLNTMEGGQRQPKIVQRARGKNKGGEHEISPTISSSKWQYNNLLKIPETSYRENNHLALPGAYGRNFGSRGKLQDKDYCDTLTASMGTGGGNVPILKIKNATKNMIINPLKDKSPYGWHFEQNVYDIEGITRSVKAGNGSGNIPKIILGGNMNNSRIRKLTPKECWRLMGFDDTDFEKAEKVNSNTQLYKQAGNSIVVNVLEYILTNLLEEK